MTWLALIAGLSLFSGLDYQAGGLTLRPFDFLTAIMGLALLAKAFARGSLKIPPGFLWLLPFCLITSLSAMTVSTGNGIREGLQMCIVLTFALAYSNADDPCPRGATWVFLFCVMWGLLLFNIGWHINEGHYTGWKKLNELKHTIGLTTMLTIAWIAMRQFRATFIQLLIFGVLGGIIVLSGERKSLIIYLFAALLLMNAIGLRRSIQVLIAPVVIVSLTMLLFADDYTMRHIDSLTLTTEYTVAGEPESHSNQQRAFAFKAGWAMFEESPIVGIGTNAFQTMVERAFAYYPRYLIKGIHGEFFRILVENGLIGLVSYVAIWLVSIIRTVALARALRTSGRLNRREATNFLRVYFMYFVTAATICGLEGGGSDLFVLMALVSLWPDLSRMTFWQRSPQTRQPVPSLEPGRV